MEVWYSEYIENFDLDNEDDKVKVNEVNYDMNILYKELCKVRFFCFKLILKENIMKKNYIEK